MSISAPPPIVMSHRMSSRGMMSSVRSAIASTRSIVPSRPESRIDRIWPTCGWYRQWNASMSTSPAASAAATISRASSALAAIGFSHSTGLPAASAASVQRRWSAAGVAM